MKSNKKKIIIEIIISVVGIFLCNFGVLMFNGNLMNSFPLIVKMILMIVMYWLIALVPIIFCVKNKYKFKDFGFSTNKVLKQVLLGIISSLVMSFIFVVIPILIFGKENTYVVSGYNEIWKYIFMLVYYIVSVGLVEEFCFRGYLLNELKKISKNNAIPIIVTSVLFGFLHIFVGNIIQVIITSFMGLILVLCKEKIKDYSLLSLIIAHGIYDWSIIIIAQML